MWLFRREEVGQQKSSTPNSVLLADHKTHHTYYGLLRRCHVAGTAVGVVTLGTLLVMWSCVRGSDGVTTRHSEGLNRWSFLSQSENNDLYSDLLCPNPMLSGGENRIVSSSSSKVSSMQNFSASSAILLRDGDNAPIPNDIWALKTTNEITFLPCDLKQYASIHTKKPHPRQSPSGTSPQDHLRSDSSNTIYDSGVYVDNKILFMNISFKPFDFSRAKLCNKFIKLQIDAEDGVELNCDKSPEGTGSEFASEINRIYWPRSYQKRKKAFSIFKNLERFLQNEDSLRKRFYFQVFFTSTTGRSKKCTIQQYELNLGEPGCSSRRPRIEDICGEFSCHEVPFPYFEQQRVNFIWKSDAGLGQSQEGGGGPLVFIPKFDTQPSNHSINKFFSRKFDIRFIVFITCLPIILFGMLIFGLEIIIYVTCLRRSRNTGDSGGRSQQILQNSLNLWESIPNREVRTVSFSPVTTNIDRSGGESPLPDPLGTPRVLKSALKKSTEHLPPPPAHFFENEREYPPTYVEAMNH